jgi:hypothetical protein
MRKILLVLVALMVVFALIGCDNGTKARTVNTKTFFVEADDGGDEEDPGPQAPTVPAGVIVGSLDGWFEANATPDGVIGSIPGTDTFLKQVGTMSYSKAGGNFVIPGRTQNWHGIDIVIPEDVTTKKYTVYVEVVGSPAGIKLGQPDDPWGTLTSTLTNTIPATLVYEVPANYLATQPAVRVQADVGVASFSLSDIKVIMTGAR